MISPDEEEPAQWNVLFNKLRFFQRFEHFIRVDILTREGAQAHYKWKSYIETQIKRLADEVFKFDSIISLRIYPIAFSDQNIKNHEETSQP